MGQSLRWNVSARAEACNGTIIAMRTPQTLTALDEVFVAFHHPYLEPPPPPATIGQGATATFRAAMARFSAGGLHAHRRAEVVALVESVDVAVVRSTAFKITHSTLEGRVLWM